ncbi:MAG: polysaccharide pyruvyl transferase family protein [Deltaproteobacteria bacterium]|nr:polysaccharide pyruvyl transferase family protein [Deltaproteobacteria bacterium]
MNENAAENYFQAGVTFFQQNEVVAAAESFQQAISCGQNPAFSAFMLSQIAKASNDTDEQFRYLQTAMRFDDSHPMICSEAELWRLRHGNVSEAAGRLLHFFPFTPNIGDSGSAMGIRKMLREQHADDLFFLSQSCRTAEYAEVQSLSSQFDGIVIGGGGLYFSNPTPSGWYFPFSAKQLQSLQLPVFTYGVGLNREFAQTDVWRVDDDLQHTLAAFHTLFLLASARDYWSVERLRKYSEQPIAFVPCPSAFLEPLDWYRLNFSPEQRGVALSVTVRGLSEAQQSRVAAVWLDFEKWLQTQGYEPFFVFQDSADDMSLIALFSNSGANVLVPTTAREAVSIYAQCHTVVGMRGHSAILSAGQCTPVATVAYNRKVSAFMDSIGLQDYTIDLDDAFSLQTMIDLFRRIQENRTSVINVLQRKKEAFLQHNRNFARQILSVIKRGSKGD